MSVNGGNPFSPELFMLLLDKPNVATLADMPEVPPLGRLRILPLLPQMTSKRVLGIRRHAERGRN